MNGCPGTEITGDENAISGGAEIWGELHSAGDND